MVKEIIWLRSLACIAVVLVHALSWTIARNDSDMSSIEGLAYRAIQAAALFGTPAFVFISEFLISKSYPKPTKGFLRKRIKFILIPYFFMSLFYAVLETSALQLNAHPNLYLNFLNNFFLGDFHGYFIIIIFQFYILHIVFTKYLSGFSPKLMLIITFIINFSYLAFFNFVQPFNIPFAENVWAQKSSLPFLGWVFYFALAFYGGRNPKEFLRYLEKHKTIVILAPFVTFSLIIFNMYFMVLNSVSSKRVDMPLYTIAIICFVFLITSKIKTVPRWAAFISRYSFGIYLLHPFVQSLINDISLPRIFHLPFVFTLDMVGSIVLVYLFNKLPLGQYVVGKIGKKQTTKPKEKVLPKVNTA